MISDFRVLADQKELFGLVASVRPGHQLTYSVGWELGARERNAIRLVRSRPGRSPSISAARYASAGPLPPARTGPAGMDDAGPKKRTSPS